MTASRSQRVRRRWDVVENWREMALFRGPKSAIFRPRNRGFYAQAIELTAFMSADFFDAREQEKWRAPPSGVDRVDVTRRGRVPPDTSDLLTRGRRGEAAPTATLPWRYVPLPRCERICWFEAAQHDDLLWCW